MKVGLYVRVTLDGKRKYCPPVYAANKKLKAGYALVNQEPRPFSDAVYALRYKEGGKRKWQEVGSDPQQALTEKLRREHLFQGREIGQPVSYDLGVIEHPKAKNKTSLAQAAKDYLNDLARKSKPKTINAYSAALAFFVAEVQPTIYVEDLKRADIERYIDALYRSRVSPRTISNRLGYLRSFLLSLSLRDLMVVKDKPRYTKKAPNSYNREFLARLFAACDPEERAVFTFFVRTGCREQEVMYACWSDLDLVRGTLTIRKKDDLSWTLKDYEERTVPLAPSFVSALRERRRERPHDRFIFPTKDGKPNGHFLRKLKRVALRAGLNCGHCVNKKGESCHDKPVCAHVDLHRFRRTFATIAHHEGGRSAKTIQRWLGHSDLQTTMLYLASAEDDAPQVRVLLDEAFSFAV
jgi:integrase/recombinase XerD